MPSAATFSSRFLRRLVPGIGTTPSWAISHARASWAGVTPFAAAISFTRSTNSRFFLKFPLEPRPVAAPVVRRQILEASQLAGEEAPAERAVRDVADAQLTD